MPLVEIIHAANPPASVAQKRAFTDDLVEIFGEVLGTPEGRLQVIFYPLDWQDSIAGLRDSEADTGP